MKKEFTDERNKTGTREWSERSSNIGYGCSNGCLYCYARHRVETWLKKIPAGTWTTERPDMKKADKRERPTDGVIMFPTAHDITEAYLPGAMLKITKHLQAGNKILIVSKPRPEIIARLIKYLNGPAMQILNPREKILFRFSITTLDPIAAAFWEPGAPRPADRVRALIETHAAGYQTSVSAEPILPGTISYIDTARAIYTETEKYITDTLWLGTLNKAAARIKGATPELLAQIEAYQAPANIIELGHIFSPGALYPKIKFKDSAAKIIIEDIHARNSGQFEI